MPSKRGCSAVQRGTGAVWKRNYAIFCGAPRLRSLLRPEVWGRRSRAYSARSDSKPIFPSCVDTPLSPSILSHDYSGYERAFGADAPNARPERCRLARPTTKNVGLDYSSDGTGSPLWIADSGDRPPTKRADRGVRGTSGENGSASRGV